MAQIAEEDENLTTAKAMPTNTPMLRTVEYHIGPKPLSVAELAFVPSVFGVVPVPRAGPLVVSFPRTNGDTFSSHSESTKGSAFPSKTPKNPHES